MDQTRGRVTKDGIRIYEDADFAGMRIAGQVAAEILDMMGPLVVPGVTTAALDDFIREEVERRGAVSATIGYKGYQHASCISVNHVVCHGIPGTKVLAEGIETKAELDYLVQSGIEWFQGYFFAKPQLEKLLTHSEINGWRSLGPQ